MTKDIDITASEVIDDLPPLTEAIIANATRGVAAASNPVVQRAIARSLRDGERLTEGLSIRRLSGPWRQRILRFLVTLLLAMRVEGLKHIPPGPVIFAPNHLSHLDPFIVVAYLPAAPFCSLIGDGRAMFNYWWKRLIVSLVGGVIPINRRWKEERAVVRGVAEGHTDLSALAERIDQYVPERESIAALRQLDRIMMGLLQQKESILIFPEGRLGEVEGQLHTPLKRGIALYALRSGIPIVPVGLRGTHGFALRKTVTMRFGEPIVFPSVAHPTSRSVREALDTLTVAMQKLI